VLLAALSLALTGAGGGVLRIDVEGHGREELASSVDVSRTTGWFTTLFPVLLETGGGPGATLRAVKERMRAVPEKGIGYGLLRYLADEPTLADLRQPTAPSDVLFNYLGQFGPAAQEERGTALLRPAPESPGPLEGRRGARHHLLEVNAVITGGRLRVTWGYSTDLHRPETVERLAHDFLGALRSLIEHCRGMETTELTPSDFPLAALDEEGFEGLAALLEEVDAPGARS
jgi:non-ribosomal peptide synthase protein (TIGR01720 family)